MILYCIIFIWQIYLTSYIYLKISADEVVSFDWQIIYSPHATYVTVPSRERPWAIRNYALSGGSSSLAEVSETWLIRNGSQTLPRYCPALLTSGLHARLSHFPPLSPSSPCCSSSPPPSPYRREGSRGLIVSLFPTPLSNATGLNGVIVVSGRAADNSRGFQGSRRDRHPKRATSIATALSPLFARDIFIRVARHI